MGVGRTPHSPVGKEIADGSLTVRRKRRRVRVRVRVTQLPNPNPNHLPFYPKPQNSNPQKIQTQNPKRLPNLLQPDIYDQPRNQITVTPTEPTHPNQTPKTQPNAPCETPKQISQKDSHPKRFASKGKRQGGPPLRGPVLEPVCI